MSRIAGIVSSRQDASADVSMMLSAVSGMDWRITKKEKGRATFGWAGQDPVCIGEKSGNLVAIDGCVYNCDNFEKTETLPELLIHLYDKLGFVEMVKAINGDFAIALYDTSDDVLWLARDRFGIKPLYYFQNKDQFAFASRLKSLLILPGIDKTPRREYIGRFAGTHYRHFDNESDKSPYEGIYQLPAAHILQMKNGRITLNCYWRLHDLSEWKDEEDNLADRYRELLFDAVSRRMKKAGNPAFTLSGGMDSSSVLASAVCRTGEKQHAYSSVYEDETYDESDEIRSMLDATVDEWHKVIIGTPDVFSIIGRMIDIHDEPVATATWLSHFILCEEVSKQGFDCLFGGLGGDELNAGEYEHFFYFFADLRASGQEERLEREMVMWIRYHDHPIFKKSRQFMEDGMKRLVDLKKPGHCLADRKRLERYLAALNMEFFDLKSFEPIMEHPFTTYLNNRCYQDMTRETIPCCLRAEDRQTSVFGLNNYLPFFDHRLVEFMFRVPFSMKYKDGVTKHLLRKAMTGVLPESTRTRVKKTGWNAPAHQWFSGKGNEQILDLVHTQSFRQRGIYNLSEVEHLIEEHEKIVLSGEPKDNHMMFLWQLVNLELWLNRF